MKLEFTQATPADSKTIGKLVVNLTAEICERTNAQYFDIELEDTVQRCKELLITGTVIINLTTKFRKRNFLTKQDLTFSMEMMTKARDTLI